jgi:hypothetical protein
MAADPRKRQKKLERRTAKRQEKKHRLVREQNAGLAERLTAAARYPVLHAWIGEALWTQGLGQVLLSRALPDGSVAFAVFLVDRYCLGVKDAFGNVLGRSLYDDKCVRDMRSKLPARDVSAATVRKLVEGAVAYAADLGLPPHPDYHKTKPILAGIDLTESAEEFEFGKDGKPLFVAGPHDTPARCRQIVDTLVRTRGPDEFHLVLPLRADGEQFLPGAVKINPARRSGPDNEGEAPDRSVPLKAPHH